MSQERVSIVGAGLCGSLLGVYLAKRGHDVHVYEYRSDVRTLRLDGGRSINMALSHRGIRALQQVGLYERVLPHMIPMTGRMIHMSTDRPSLQPYGTQKDHLIYSISRKILNEILLDGLDEYSCQLHFDTKCTNYDLDSQTLYFSSTKTDREWKVKNSFVFGTDGAFSKIRQAMMRQDRFTYGQSYIDHGYKELTMPAGNDGQHIMEREALHIWPRQHFMLIALPNPDGTFTCTLFLDFDGPVSFAALDAPDKVQAFFQKEFPDVVDTIPDLLDQFSQNPTSSLVTISCDPWNVGDHTILLGDAAHAIVPFFGQGMNASFEDVRLFCALLDQSSMPEAISSFSNARKKDADAISTMALENFVEMRDAVADPVFQQRKKIAHKLERERDDFMSRYSLVSFTSEPYAKVYEQGVKNDELIDTLL